MRIGLVGYGLGGRLFHAPFIEAADGVELVGAVTRDPTRRAELAEDFPGVRAYDSLSDLLDAGVEAVTITTPPHTRRDLVLEAIERGVSVVADKPFAPDAAAGQELVDAAAAAGVPLAVFHNRRWDTDIRTLRAVLDSGELGQPWRIDSRYDIDDPGTIDPGPSGGLLRDLGTHLADQMVWLFGPVSQVYAVLDWIDLPEGRTDAGFTVTMRHVAGPVSTITASKANRAAGREIRVYAEGGSYHSSMSDVQFAAVRDGRRPIDEGDAWGFEDEERWGTLSTAAGVRKVLRARRVPGLLHPVRPRGCRRGRASGHREGRGRDLAGARRRPPERRDTQCGGRRESDRRPCVSVIPEPVLWRRSIGVTERIGIEDELAPPASIPARPA